MTHSEREHTPQRIYGREEEIGKERQSGLCHVRVFSVFLSCHSFFFVGLRSSSPNSSCFPMLSIDDRSSL